MAQDPLKVKSAVTVAKIVDGERMAQRIDVAPKNSAK
jgi:hypothetical protein